MKTKRMHKFAYLFSCFSALVLALALTVIVPHVTAYADSEMSLRIDFSDSTVFATEGTVTAEKHSSRLGKGASVTTNAKFTCFMAYIDITVTEGTGFEIAFGDSAVKFGADDTVTTELNKTGGTRTFDFSDFESGGIVFIEAIGGKVSFGVSARVAPENLLYEPVAVFDAENTLGTISVKTDENTQAVLRYIDVYSLDSTVNIEPDDYDPNDGKAPVKPGTDGANTNKPNTGLPGYGFALIVIGSVLVAAGVAVAVILVVKRRAKEKGNRVEKEKNDNEE